MIQEPATQWFDYKDLSVSARAHERRRETSKIKAEISSKLLGNNAVNSQCGRGRGGGDDDPLWIPINASPRHPAIQGVFVL